MTAHGFSAPASRWFRCSRYIIQDGFIRPAPNASLAPYEPWQLYRSGALTDHSPAPHRALIALLSEEELLKLTPRAEEAILEWCRQYGLLGLLLEEIQMAVLAPRWSGSPPGILMRGDTTRRLITPVARRLIRSVRGWNDRSTFLTRMYSSDQVDDGQLVSSEHIPDKWRAEDWDQPWALRRASNGDWSTESLEITWGRFFPDIPVEERETYPYPSPSEPEFWKLYAEPVYDFLHAAMRFHEILRTFAAWHAPERTQKASRDEHSRDAERLAAQDSMLRLDSLFTSVHPCLHFSDDGTPQLQWNSASLLGSIAMMAVQDLLAGTKLHVCANPTCSTLFLGNPIKRAFAPLDAAKRRRSDRIASAFAPARSVERNRAIMTGSIRPQGKGSWEIRLYLGRNEAGRKRYKSHTVKGTKRDAQRELAKLLNSVHEGNYVSPARLTVAEFVERWLTDYAKQKVAAKTFERYAELLRLHLVPQLGKHALSKLEPLHIQHAYSKLLENGRRDGKGGLSAQTVVHCHRVLRKALQHAVKWQLVVRNPAAAADAPRVERREMSTLDETGVAALFQAVRGTRLELPVVLAITTGLRRGELLALRWRDVDLEKGVLAVRQSIEQTKGRLAFKEPKTKRGRRVVALPNVAIEALRRHRTTQAKRRLQLGSAYEDRGLVLTRLDGRPMDPAETSKAFARVVAKANLPHLSLHGLRHTHATLLLRANVHPKVVSERLGHATIGITLDTYSHVLPDMQEAAAKKLDILLGSSL